MRSARDPSQAEAGAFARPAPADAADFLEQLSTSRLVQDGGVNLISLDAVRRRMGAQWPRRQAEVWRHVDAAVHRLGPDTAYYRRIDEVDFVIAVRGVDAGVAQALCLKVATDTLTRFLGAAEAVTLSNVTGIAPGELACRPVDVASLPPPGDLTISVAIGEATALDSATGLSLSVSHVLEPFINLGNGRPAGMCAEPVVHDLPTGRRLPGFVLSRLPDADLARIDSLGLAFAHRTPTAYSKAHSLLVPLSLQTLSSTWLRAAALAELKARKLNSAWVVILSHIEQGTPPVRLAETAALLRPHCGAVFASVPATSTSFGHLSECRFHGLVIDLERWAHEPERAAHYLRTFGEKAAGLAAVLAVRGLASEALFETAREAGLTHASVRAVSHAPGGAG